MTHGRHLVHVPVMVREVLFYLDPKPGQIVVDCTCGAGGHAERILPAIVPGGRLIGIDRDADVLAVAAETLAGFSGNFELHHADFSGLRHILSGPVDAMLFDLGVSSHQLDRPERGFSFAAEGPLDMRMDTSRGQPAAVVLQQLSERELQSILRDYGEERFARRIAKAIKQAVSSVGIRTTGELADVVVRAYPKRGGRLHPATRTFQALRIHVNRELEELETAMHLLPGLLKSGGRAVVISYHSLEDRIVKRAFRQHATEGSLEILATRPVRPQPDEVRRNRRSRSARLRAARKP